MMLLGQMASRPGEPDVWSAHADVDAGAAEVLRALTDPELIACWAPVSFDVEGLAGRRLRAGGRERVSGSIAGIRTTFEIEVERADLRQLKLVARGPVLLEVDYRFRERDERVAVEARVGVHPRGGLKAQVLRAAVVALLSAGALGGALHRLEESLCDRFEPQLVAA
jgi:hypothetical protein